jgi:glycosyltransferase involved in cell wall biosynthesis
MKLLILSNNLNNPGFRQRIEVFLDTLRTNGIKCEVAKLPLGSLARKKLFKKARDFDGVLLHRKKLNFFDAFWLGRYSKKLIYHFDDAIMYSDKNPERPSRSRLIPFRRSVKLADMVIAGSSYLAEHARKFNPNVEILLTGIKFSDYQSEGPSKDNDRIRLVWIGSKSTLRYLAEIKPALEEVGSRFDNVILRIICDDFMDLENMPVEKRIWSKDTRATELATCDIGLAPLPDNPFTRGKCSFKVFEYASAGLPVVASPIGTNSDYVRNNVTGFLVTDTPEWIDKITQLINEPQLRKKMGQNGRAHAQKFDISVIGEQFTRLIKDCLQDTVE